MQQGRKRKTTDQSLNSKVKGGKTVSSKIELTDKTRSNKRSDGLLQYRKTNVDNGNMIRDYSIKVCRENLLNAKLSLWYAIQAVEKMLKERR